MLRAVVNSSQCLGSWSVGSALKSLSALICEPALFWPVLQGFATAGDHSFQPEMPGGPDESNSYAASGRASARLPIGSVTSRQSVKAFPPGFLTIVQNNKWQPCSHHPLKALSKLGFRRFGVTGMARASVDAVRLGWNLRENDNGIFQEDSFSDRFLDQRR